MRLILGEQQFAFAIDGMSLSGRSYRIAHGYFIDGRTKTDIAHEEEVSVPYISKLIKRIERNFQHNLDARNLKIEVFLAPKGEGDE